RRAGQPRDRPRPRPPPVRPRHVRLPPAAPRGAARRRARGAPAAGAGSRRHGRRRRRRAGRHALAHEGALLLRPDRRGRADPAGARRQRREPGADEALAGRGGPRHRVRPGVGHAAADRGRRLRADGDARARAGRAAPAVGPGVGQPRAVAGARGARGLPPRCLIPGGYRAMRNCPWTGIVAIPTVSRVTLLPPDVLADRLRSGLLSFPVTLFDDDLRFDEPRYREHLAWQAGFDVAGLFAAGGTGEGFSLTPPEVDRVVRAAVDEVGDRVPVIAPATGGTALAVAQAKAAQDAGASGVLLFPPYLTEAGQRGLAEHVSAVCRATDLGVIFYNRANAVLTDATVAELADRNPNLVGFKDGVGDIERLTRIYARL